MTIRYSKDYDPQSLPGIVAQLVAAVNSGGGGAINGGITATPGVAQKGAVNLHDGINEVTVSATKGDSVLLPTALPGAVCIVANSGANNISIFPVSGETIGNNDPDESQNGNPGSVVTFVCTQSGFWNTDYGDDLTLDGTKVFNDLITAVSGILIGEGVQLAMGSSRITMTNYATTLSGNAADITGAHLNTITTEGLTTAAGASQAFTLTYGSINQNAMCIITPQGGTNTRHNFKYEAVLSANTITVTVYNTEPTNALNGTLKFKLLILEANA